MIFTWNQKNNTKNGFITLENPTKVVSFMFLLLLLTSYLNTLLRMAAILDLSNMAATEGAHVGSLEKLADYGHI